MKLVILLLLTAIVVSLGSGLFFLARDRDDQGSTRLLTALKIRVALSIVLVLFLVAAYFTGWIEPPTSS